MIKLTVALLRCSTDMQDFDSQKSAIEGYCKGKCIVIDKFIEEYDVSGFSTPLNKREGLMEIKELAMNGELERVVVFNLDRIGRDSELNAYVTMLDNLGVELLSVTEGKITNENINDKLINQIKFWQAESESIKIGLRSRAGLRAVNQQGKYAGGYINYGYQLNPVTRQLEVNPDEAIIVKRIFKSYLTKGAINIAKELNAEGLKKRSLKGYIDFNTSGIGKMLDNKIYIGYKQYGGTIKPKDKTDKNRILDKSKIQYQDYNPNLQIIDNELFEKVQLLRENRLNRKDSNNRTTTRTKDLLEGLCYHKCGDGKLRKLYINKVFKDKNKTEYYTTYKCKHCSGMAYEGVRKNYKAEDVNEFVEGYINKVMGRVDEDKLRANFIKLQGDVFEDIEIKIKSLEVETSKQQKIYNNANKELERYFLGESSLTPDVISSMIKKSETKIKELNTQIKELNIKLTSNENNNSNITHIISKYKNFNVLYKSADILHRKAMMEEIIDKVVIDGNDIEIILKLGIFF